MLLHRKRTAAESTGGLTFDECLRRSARGAFDHPVRAFDRGMVHGHLFQVIGIELHVDGHAGGKLRPGRVRDGLLGVSLEGRGILGEHLNGELQHRGIVTDADTGVSHADDFGGRLCACFANLVIELFLRP